MLWFSYIWYKKYIVFFIQPRNNVLCYVCFHIVRNVWNHKLKSTADVGFFFGSEQKCSRFVAFLNFTWQWCPWTIEKLTSGTHYVIVWLRSINDVVINVKSMLTMSWWCWWACDCYESTRQLDEVVNLLLLQLLLLILLLLSYSYWATTTATQQVIIQQML